MTIASINPGMLSHETTMVRLGVSTRSTSPCAEYWVEAPASSVIDRDASKQMIRSVGIRETSRIIIIAGYRQSWARAASRLAPPRRYGRRSNFT